MHNFKLILALFTLASTLQGMIEQGAMHDLLLRESYAHYGRNDFSTYYERNNSLPAQPAFSQSDPSQSMQLPQQTPRQHHIQLALITNQGTLARQEKQDQTTNLALAIISIGSIAGTSLYTWHTLTHATPETSPNALSAIRNIWIATGSICISNIVNLGKWWQTRNKLFATQGMLGYISLCHGTSVSTQEEN